MPNDIANNMANTIHQLEEQLQVELDNSHCLEIELKEAKRLLKAAVEDFTNIELHMYSCDGMCNDCPLYGERDNCTEWRYADEVERLLNDEK